jgi:hypothetical protein
MGRTGRGREGVWSGEAVRRLARVVANPAAYRRRRPRRNERGAEWGRRRSAGGGR